MFYVNLDGMYGNGAYEKPEFRTIHNLLAEMDRLGIWASVTVNSESKDLSTLYGNRKLMEDIYNTGSQNRIIPCFAISPAMLYAPEEFGYLLKHLKNGEIGFVSVFPSTNRHALCEIERVLNEISKFNPIVIVDAEEMQKSDYKDLAVLATRFSKLHFIIRNVMWWQFSATADLMWRCKNIYVDTARLHFRGAIKSVVQFLGRGRAIFGLGSVTNGGAAISSLCYSDIEESMKEEIAGFTVLKLMDNQKKAEEIIRFARELKPQVKNSFWEPFIQGKGIRNSLVIDAHTHIGPMARGWYMPNSDIKLQLDDIEKDMLRFGIKQMVTTPEIALFGNPIEGCGLVAGIIKERHLNINGYLPFNPHYSDILTDKIINELFNDEFFIGFKIIPEYWRIEINNLIFNKVWNYANKYRLPILIHTWEGTYGTPEMIEPLAAEYPGAIFILGHSGGSTKGREQAIRAANRYNNIYLEFCGSFMAKQRWDETLKHVDKNRVLFGTDTYPHDIAWELGRLLSMDIDDDTIKLILGKNMERVLKERLSISS